MKRAVILLRWITSLRRHCRRFTYFEYGVDLNFKNIIKVLRTMYSKFSYKKHSSKLTMTPRSEHVPTCRLANGETLNWAMKAASATCTKKGGPKPRAPRPDASKAKSQCIFKGRLDELDNLII